MNGEKETAKGAGENLSSLSDELQNKLNQIKALNALDVNELNQIYTKRQKISKELGKRGWVISADRTPDNQKEWLDLIEANGEESVSQFYSEYDVDEMIDNIETTYNKSPEKYYINRAVENYFTGHYTEAAVFLIAVLDYRISSISPTDLRRKSRQLKDIEIHKKEELFLDLDCLQKNRQ